jgi:hypothetical protein
VSLSSRDKELIAEIEEMPEITACAYNSVSMTMDHSGDVVNYFSNTAGEMPKYYGGHDLGEFGNAVWADQSVKQDRLELVNKSEITKKKKSKKKSPKKSGIKTERFDCRKESNMSGNDARRMVKVIIVDNDENVPLDKCVLYNGEEQITDLTNQELFFELDMKDMLAKHNKIRGKIVDKEASSKDEKVYLEPIKIRDLVMSVATIATF